MQWPSTLHRSPPQPVGATQKPVPGKAHHAHHIPTQPRTYPPNHARRSWSGAPAAHSPRCGALTAPPRAAPPHVAPPPPLLQRPEPPRATRCPHQACPTHPLLLLLTIVNTYTRAALSAVVVTADPQLVNRAWLVDPVDAQARRTFPSRSRVDGARSNGPTPYALWGKQLLQRPRVE